MTPEDLKTKALAALERAEKLPGAPWVAAIEEDTFSDYYETNVNVYSYAKAAQYKKELVFSDFIAEGLDSLEFAEILCKMREDVPLFAQAVIDLIEEKESTLKKVEDLWQDICSVYETVIENTGSRKSVPSNEVGFLMERAADLSRELGSKD